MKHTTYTPELAAEGERIYNAIENVPKESRAIVSLMVEAFINGMQAQKRLAARPSA